MGKKKKRMTPAQAAAARREDRPKRREPNAAVKDSGPRDRGNTFVLGVTVAMVALIVVLSLVFTVGPFSVTG